MKFTYKKKGFLQSSREIDFDGTSEEFEKVKEFLLKATWFGTVANEIAEESDPDNDQS